MWSRKLQRIQVFVFKFNWYQFKIDCHCFRMFYAIPMTTIKKYPWNIQKRKGESNQNVSVLKNN